MDETKITDIKETPNEQIIRKQIINRVEDTPDKDIFAAFSWEGKDLAKHNVFLGLNGRGKTTIARMFKSPNSYREQLNLKDQSITAENIKVFSIDFIKNELFFDDNVGKDVKPILYLGEENINLQQELGVKEEYLAKIKEEKKEVEDNHNASLTDVARNIFKETKIWDTRKWNRDNIKKQIEALLVNKRDPLLLSDEKKMELKNIVSADNDKIKRVQEYSQLDGLNNLGDQMQEVKELLNKEVKSKRIEEYINNQELESWVRQGLNLHEEKDLCKFCGSQRRNDIKEKLHKHFDQSYVNLESNLKVAIGKCTNLNISENKKDEVHPVYLKNYEIAFKEYTDTIKEYNNLQNILRNKLENKLDNMFASIDIDINALPNNIDLNEKIDNLNRIIELQNSNKEGREKQINQAKQKLIDDYIGRNCFKQHKNWERQNEEKQELMDGAKERIKQIKKELNNHNIHAKEINQRLFDCFDHERIKFESVESGYRVFRDGKPAQYLSEGEKNIIALIYFCQTLSTKNRDVNEIGIENICMVVDDPISSLDEDSSGYALSILMGKAKNVGQTIFLTHNIKFTKDCVNEFKHINVKGEALNCYILDLDNVKRAPGHLKIKSIDENGITKLNRYYSEFEKVYLILDKTNYNLSPTENQDLPRQLRTIIEGFGMHEFPSKIGIYQILFNIFGNPKDDSPKFTEVTTITKWIGEGNHTKQDSAYNPLSLSGKGKQYAEVIMRAIEGINSHHYNGMKFLITKNQEVTGDKSNDENSSNEIPNKTNGQNIH